jgi:hypothetical protein
MTLQAIFWTAMAIAMFVIVPIALVKTTIDYFRGSGSQRKGTGGVSGAISGAMQELDRILTRPSVEYKIETEHQILKREDESGED